MTFTDDARSESGRKAPNPCSVGTFLSALSEADRADVTEALADDDIRGEAIARVIERRFDEKIQGQTIQRHRNRRCQCG